MGALIVKSRKSKAMETNNQTFLIPRLQQVLQLGIMVDCYTQDFPKQYNKSASFKQIAYMLGFTEPTSFYRYFRNATGMTAKQYRERVENL